MSLIFNGMMAGLGQGIATVGAATMKREAELEEIRARAELRRQETLDAIRERAELTGLTGKGKNAGFDLNNEEHRRMFGLKDPDSLDRSQFMREEQPLTPMDDDGNAMPKSGRMVEDTEGYDKARKGIIEENIRNYTRTASPDKFDDLTKGEYNERVNKMVDEINAEKDQKVKQAKIDTLNQLAGKKVYDLNSNGQVLHIGSGEVKDTDLSRAKMDREKAAATEDRAQAGAHSAKAEESRADARLKDRTDPNLKGGKGGSGKDGKELTNQEVIRAYSEARKAYEKNSKDPDAKRDFEMARTAYRERFGEKSPEEAAKSGSGSSQAAKAPYPEGKKLIGPDGKTYIVRNGKPELLK